jgi:hypothetical protein
MTPPSEPTIILYRPTGSAELALVEQSGFTRWPPRLPEQPIFYPVTREAYAVQIARDWNTKFDDKRGYVTRFAVKALFLANYERKIAGGRALEEYWIPAEDLEALNDAIVGLIEVVGLYGEAHRLAHEASMRSRFDE